MDRSQYLVQALQQMQQPAAAPQAAPDFSGLQAGMAKADAWKAANPGQSYIGHNLAQAGQNVAAAPGNVMANLKSLFGGGS